MWEEGHSDIFGTLDPMSGVPGLGKGYFWRYVGAFLDQLHKTKVVRYQRYCRVDMVWNLIQVSFSWSMAPGRLCSHGHLTDWSQTW